MAVITFSRQFGSGARTLGANLAKRLGYRYLHEDMIKEIAKHVKTSPRQILDFEKRGTTKLMKFLDKVVSRDFIDRLTAEDYVYIDEKRYVKAVKAVIERIYKEGNAVIIERGSQFILEGRKNTLHIMMAGGMEYRIRFLMDTYFLKENEAERAIKRADHIRSRFLSFFADEALHDHPISYDLCLNMERIGMERAESLIIDLLSKLDPGRIA